MYIYVRGYVCVVCNGQHGKETRLVVGSLARWHNLTHASAVAAAAAAATTTTTTTTALSSSSASSHGCQPGNNE